MLEVVDFEYIKKIWPPGSYTPRAEYQLDAVV